MRDAVHIDLRAFDGELERQRRAGARHGELHGRAARSAHARHRRVEVIAHRRAVDGGDHVAAVDAGRGGRRVAKRAHHAQRVIRGRHFDADARVGAGGADAQIGVFLGVEIGGIRIEAAHQAAQRIVDERGIAPPGRRTRAARAPALRRAARLRQRSAVFSWWATAGSAAARAAGRLAMREHSAAEGDHHAEHDPDGAAASWAQILTHVGTCRGLSPCGASAPRPGRRRVWRPPAPAARRAPRPPAPAWRWRIPGRSRRPASGRACGSPRSRRIRPRW